MKLIMSAVTNDKQDNVHRSIDYEDESVLRSDFAFMFNLICKFFDMLPVGMTELSGEVDIKETYVWRIKQNHYVVLRVEP